MSKVDKAKIFTSLSRSFCLASTESKVWRGLHRLTHWGVMITSLAPGSQVRTYTLFRTSRSRGHYHWFLPLLTLPTKPSSEIILASEGTSLNRTKTYQISTTVVIVNQTMRMWNHYMKQHTVSTRTIFVRKKHLTKWAKNHIRLNVYSKIMEGKGNFLQEYRGL